MKKLILSAAMSFALLAAIPLAAQNTQKADCCKEKKECCKEKKDCCIKDRKTNK